MVRVPDAAAQVTSAPVKALRGFFAGIGQLLMTADLFRTQEGREAGRQELPVRGLADPELADPGLAVPEQARPEHADRYESLTAPRRAPAVRWAPDGRAGRHRASGRQGPAASAETPTRRFRSLDSTGNVRLLTPEEPGATPQQELPPDDGPARETELPLPGYDQLTLPSLRSRLRNLDAAQLRALADYERATANRADVLAMFERRIAKLQAAATHAS